MGPRKFSGLRPGQNVCAWRQWGNLQQDQNIARLCFHPKIDLSMPINLNLYDN